VLGHHPNSRPDPITNRKFCSYFHFATVNRYRINSLYFCNTPNSNCSSLGKYKIGYSYTGQFGKSYKLYGLDKTNDKAFDRAVVLHKHKSVPDAEQNYPIVLSLGCPMVSASFYSKLEKILDTSDKNVLMWIYY
jgi:hypothetical protein